MPTTGGFTALAESCPVRDAAAIRWLHDAGAVMLAKVNANDWFGKAPMVSASTRSSPRSRRPVAEVAPPSTA